MCDQRFGPGEYMYIARARRASGLEPWLPGRRVLPGQWSYAPNIVCAPQTAAGAAVQ